MKYDILQANSASELTRKVQKAIDTGWEPHGMLLAIPYHDSTTYSQSIVKHEEPEYANLAPQPIGPGRP